MSSWFLINYNNKDRKIKMLASKLFASRRAMMQMKNMNFVAMQQARYFAITTKYTKTHEWISYDDSNDIATIGITDHAQAELGDIVHVDLPEVGTEFSKSEVITAVESVKTAADIYQMVDGEVVEVNEELADDSSILNSDAEGKGWIMKVKLSNKSQLGDLLDEAAYKDIL